eukprot:comp5229_c0_seq1/m.1265 comp5229_c0_seq1/g.1265  ORF comp5229_c0_seq1/g.1265 comp5229_c0_seq1/m.1265 type:complete len:395 (-) comp5229_c0_seq1:26-1210(-)
MQGSQIRRLAQSVWDVAVGSLQPSPPQKMGADVIWLLGQPYLLSEDRARFLDDFQSRIWCTYRTGYAPIGGSVYTADTGWGCMLRCGQMVLAQALVMRFLGRRWRFDPHKKQEQDTDAIYYEIVGWFVDQAARPYSIHRIALEGMALDKQVGQWFGPATIAQVIKRLSGGIGSDSHQHSIATHIAMDGVVYVDQLHQCVRDFKEQVRQAHSQSPQSAVDGEDAEGMEAKEWDDLLLMVPLRLGLDTIQASYVSQLKDMFTLPFTLGIVGGRPNSAYYFVGWHGNNVLYLDPHTTQPIVVPADDGYFPTPSYHCQSVSSIGFESVDPSLALAFYLGSEEQRNEFCKHFTELRVGSTPLFTVMESMPHYYQEGNTQITRVPSVQEDDERDDEYDFV